MPDRKGVTGARANGEAAMGYQTEGELVLQRFGVHPDDVVTMRDLVRRLVVDGRVHEARSIVGHAVTRTEDAQFWLDAEATTRGLDMMRPGSPTAPYPYGGARMAGAITPHSSVTVNINALGGGGGPSLLRYYPLLPPPPFDDLQALDMALARVVPGFRGGDASPAAQVHANMAMHNARREPAMHALMAAAGAAFAQYGRDLAPPSATRADWAPPTGVDILAIWPGGAEPPSDQGAEGLLGGMYVVGGGAFGAGASFGSGFGAGDAMGGLSAEAGVAGFAARPAPRPDPYGQAPIPPSAAAPMPPPPRADGPPASWAATSWSAGAWGGQPPPPRPAPVPPPPPVDPYAATRPTHPGTGGASGPSYGGQPGFGGPAYAGSAYGGGPPAPMPPAVGYTPDIRGPGGSFAVFPLPYWRAVAAGFLAHFPVIGFAAAPRWL